MTQKQVLHILNDLITVNKNRITGYRETLHELKHERIAVHCRQMIHQSEKHNEELVAIIKEARGEIEDKTITSGVIYNIWMDIMYSDEKEPEEDIYNFCKQMERSAIAGYEAALKDINPDHIKEHDLIVRQKNELHDSLNKLEEGLQ